MSKITISPIVSGYNLTAINEAFDKVETELNDKVLYRDNPSGEPNTMKQSLDMNGNSVYNASAVSTASLLINGRLVVPSDLAYENTNERLSVKDFGAVGDGVNDDAPALQAAFEYMASNGGSLWIPSGTYRMVSNGINITSATKSFSVKGDGAECTVLLRDADFSESVINIGNFDNWSLEDFAIDAGHTYNPLGGASTFTGGNHGIAFFNCKNAKVRNVKVTNWKNSAILGYCSPPSTVDNNNIVQNCYVNGFDNSNNGILLADMWASHIIDCTAVRIGKAVGLSPCYALQLKNGVNRCSIKGGYAQGAKIGIACGTNTTTEVNQYNIISGVHVFDCNTGIAFGTGASTAINKGHVVSDLIIDMNDTGEAAFDLQRGTWGVKATNINIRNVANAKYGVRFREGDHDNFISVGVFDNSNNRSCKFVYYGPASGSYTASYNNTATLDTLINPSSPASITTDFVDNLSLDPTNKFKYNVLFLEQRSSISGGVIPMEHAWVTFVRPIPEGVVDPTPASDNLDTIGEGLPNQIITLATRLNTHTVTVKHNVGNIRLAGASDMVLNNVNDTLTLRYQYFSDTVSPYYYWVEVSRATYTTP